MRRLYLRGRVFDDRIGSRNYLAIVRGEHGVIRQIWNTWDGLADVLPLEGGGYAISIYPPAQVMEPEEEGALFTVEGTPAKIFTVTGDEALQTLVISERDNTLPATVPDFVTKWTWSQEAWSMAEGTGEDAVETRRERLQPEEDSQENRYRVLTRLMKTMWWPPARLRNMKRPSPENTC